MSPPTRKSLREPRTLWHSCFARYTKEPVPNVVVRRSAVARSTAEPESQRGNVLLLVKPTRLHSGRWADCGGRPGRTFWGCRPRTSIRRVVHTTLTRFLASRSSSASGGGHLTARKEAGQIGTMVLVRPREPGCTCSGPGKSRPAQRMRSLPSARAEKKPGTSCWTFTMLTSVDVSLPALLPLAAPSQIRVSAGGRRSRKSS